VKSYMGNLKCPSCGSEVVKNPIFKGAYTQKEMARKWMKGERQGITLNKKNLFRIDFQSLLLIIVVIILVLTYKADISRCEEVIQDPCGFCEKSNCCFDIQMDRMKGTANINSPVTRGDIDVWGQENQGSVP